MVGTQLTTKSSMSNPPTPCGCATRAEHGLPCAHESAAILDAQEQLAAIIAQFGAARVAVWVKNLAYLAGQEVR